MADIRSGEPIQLDAYQAGTLVALSIADFSEQWHGWQDEMFATAEDQGRLRYTCPKRSARVLWPGDVRPGLFLHTLSHMGRLVVAANAALETDGDARRIPARTAAEPACAFAAMRPPSRERCDRWLELK